MATVEQSFFESLRRSKAEADAASGTNWNAARDEWLAQINTLLHLVTSWLEPAVHEGLLRVERAELDISEPYLGTYPVPKLLITTANGRSARVEPHARIVLGALGRVNLVSGPNTAMLVQVTPDQWVIAVRSPGHLRQQPLTKETFLELLQSLLG